MPQSRRLSERATSKLALNVEWECPSATYGCTELALPDPKVLDLPETRLADIEVWSNDSSLRLCEVMQCGELLWDSLFRTN